MRLERERITLGWVKFQVATSGNYKMTDRKSSLLFVVGLDTEPYPLTHLQKNAIRDRD